MVSEDMPPDTTLSGSMSARDVTSLVTLFVTMLASSKGEIIGAMEANSAKAAERWQQHDKVHHDERKSLEDLQKTLDDHMAIAQARWDKERDEDLIMKGRIQPVRTVGYLLSHNWRTILLIVLGILALLGISEDAFKVFTN